MSATAADFAALARRVDRLEALIAAPVASNAVGEKFMDGSGNVRPEIFGKLYTLPTANQRAVAALLIAIEAEQPGASVHEIEISRAALGRADCRLNRIFWSQRNGWHALVRDGHLVQVSPRRWRIILSPPRQKGHEKDTKRTSCAIEILKSCAKLRERISKNDREEKK